MVKMICALPIDILFNENLVDFNFYKVYEIFVHSGIAEDSNRRPFQVLCKLKKLI